MQIILRVLQAAPSADDEVVPGKAEPTKLTRDGDVFVLGASRIGPPRPYVFGEVVFYHATSGGRVTSIDGRRLFCERDGASMFALRGGVATNNPVAIMYTGSEGADDTVLIINTSCLPDGIEGVEEMTEDERGLGLLDVLSARSAGAAERVRKMWSKNRVLHALPTQDAVVALEQQVDLLTSLVAPLVALIPTENRPEWADEFIAAVASTSVTNVRDPASVIADFSAHKAHVRSVQARYFSERDSNV